MFCKKGVLRNFTKFTGKHLYQSLIFNKVACVRPATLIKKRLWHKCFPVNFAKTSKNTFSYRTPAVAPSENVLNLFLIFYPFQTRFPDKVCPYVNDFRKIGTIGSRYSRMDQVKFFKGCLPQILLGPFFEYFVLFGSIIILGIYRAFPSKVTNRK